MAERVKPKATAPAKKPAPASKPDPAKQDDDDGDDDDVEDQQDADQSEDDDADDNQPADDDNDDEQEDADVEDGEDVEAEDPVQQPIVEQVQQPPGSAKQNAIKPAAIKTPLTKQASPPAAAKPQQPGWANRTGQKPPAKPAKAFPRPYLDSPHPFGVWHKGTLYRFLKGKTKLTPELAAFLKKDSYVADNGAEVISDDDDVKARDYAILGAYAEFWPDEPAKPRFNALGWLILIVAFLWNYKT